MRQTLRFFYNNLVQGGGFEPPNSERADLQSAVFDRFTNPARFYFVKAIFNFQLPIFNFGQKQGAFDILFSEADRNY